MKACFMGLGYIGLPTAIIAAKHGVQVTGVDVNPDVVENAFLEARARISRETEGLVLAELELEDAAVEFPRPAWLGQEVTYLGNELEDGRIEYEAMLTIDENIYYFSGIMPEEEFVKIIENFLFKTS